MPRENIHPSSEIEFSRCCFHVSQQMKEVKLLAACKTGTVSPWPHVKTQRAVAYIPPLRLNQCLTAICIFKNRSLFTLIMRSCELQML